MTTIRFSIIAATLLLVLQGAVLAQEPGNRKPPVQPSQAAEQDEPLTDRQLSLMEARILSRQGDIPQSLALYEQLRAAYPGDVEVWEDFLETLTASAQYERALFEMAAFNRRFGRTPRSERIEAGLYAELNKPMYGLDTLERAMRGNPDDTGLWSDLAFQRQASRDANGAVQAFSQVLEQDPDNQAAKDALHELLLQKRPRSQAGVNVYDQGKKTVTTTWSTSHSAQTGDSTRAFIDFNQVHFSRTSTENGVQADMSVLGARVEHEFNHDWTLDFGLQSYIGMGDGLSPMAGVRRFLGQHGSAKASYAYHLPWSDQMDAVELGGSKDRLRVEYELPFRDVWVAYAGYSRENYRLSGLNDAGYRWEGTGSLTRQLWTQPDVYLTYAFQKAEAEPSVSLPFDMVRRELSHAGTLSVSYQFFSWLEGSASGGIKHDYDRKVEAITFSPKAIMRPVERMRLELGWDYVSEGSTVAGGESNTFGANLYWVW